MIALPPFAPARCSPVIKYAGGKSWLLPVALPSLHAHLAATGGAYVEPFAGGLAIGLGLGWPKSILTDSNEDLINLYQALAQDAARVADALDEIAALGSSETAYYERRRETWPENRGRLSPFAWAVRTIYLNKIGYNGLMRFNRRGQFNVPWGAREGAFPSRAHLLQAGALLALTTIRCADFGVVLDDLEMSCGASRAALFLDPPYGGRLAAAAGEKPRAKETAPVFGGYTAGRFTWADQVRLAKAARRLARQGALVVATNAWTEAICSLWAEGFVLFQASVQHTVGATGARRGRRAELVAVSAPHAAAFRGSPLISQPDRRAADFRLTSG